MGSVRRGLILALVPGAAWAEVCDKVRPGWNGAAATPLTEAVGLLTAPAGLFLLAATAVAVALRSQWGGLVAVLMWTGYITLVTMSGQAERAAAMIEGCVASPVLFIVVVAAICVGTVLYTMPRKADDQ